MRLVLIVFSAVPMQTLKPTVHQEIRRLLKNTVNLQNDQSYRGQISSSVINLFGLHLDASVKCLGHPVIFCSNSLKRNL